MTAADGLAGGTAANGLTGVTAEATRGGPGPGAALPRLGFGLPVSDHWATPEGIRRVAQAAEARGYASLWTFQRMLSPVGASLGAGHHSVLDSFAALGFAAACTERIRLGTATICAPFTAPVLLAKAFASIDVLSGGRMSAGVGMGWLEAEYAAAGVPMARRGARFDEYLRCLRAIWTEDPVAFAGEFYTVPASRIAPAPVQHPSLPLLVGGTAAPALRRAGRLADGWIASSKLDLSTLAASIATVREGAREVGRDPDVLAIVVRGVVELTEDAEAAREARAPLQGTRAQILADLAELRATGVDEVLLDLNLSPRLASAEADLEGWWRYVDAVLDAFAPASRPGELPTPELPPGAGGRE